MQAWQRSARVNEPGWSSQEVGSYYAHCAVGQLKLFGCFFWSYIYQAGAGGLALWAGALLCPHCKLHVCTQIALHFFSFFFFSFFPSFFFFSGCEHLQNVYPKNLDRIRFGAAALPSPSTLVFQQWNAETILSDRVKISAPPAADQVQMMFAHIQTQISGSQINRVFSVASKIVETIMSAAQLWKWLLALLIPLLYVS